MTISAISAEKARRLLDEGATILDIREADERARMKIPGSSHLPLSRLPESDLTQYAGKPVVFHCKSGARTFANASRFAEMLGPGCAAFVIEGGIDAWRKAGLPVLTDRRQPIELQRQVQIGAGSMVLIGSLLGLSLSPWFFVVPLFVGTGLMFAGVTGFCGLARILVRMPWNSAVSRPQVDGA
jgi:rhodanese-related sulfurtransferase